MRVLVVEDDSLIGDAIQKFLTRSGYAVDLVVTGRNFRTAYATHEYGCVVLDLGLPNEIGEGLLAHMRGKGSRTPVLLVTAREIIRNKLALLEMGFDDFIVKPIDLDELEARINAILRRELTGTAETNASTHGPLTLIPQRFLSLWHGNVVTLTHREFWVLEVLIRRKNQVLSRAQIEEAIYGWGAEVESNAIEVYVHNLRRKFSTQLIHTIRGVGYKIAAAHQI